MKNILYTLLWSLTCFTHTYLQSQMRKRIIENGVSLTAKLEKHSWSKSGDSFCAQGSSYFVLHVNPGIGNDSTKNNLSFTHVVETPEDEGAALKLNSFVGEVVSVSGQILERKIPINSGEGDQHPINPLDPNAKFWSCKVFRIIKINTYCE